MSEIIKAIIGELLSIEKYKFVDPKLIAEIAKDTLRIYNDSEIEI